MSNAIESMSVLRGAKARALALADIEIAKRHVRRVVGTGKMALHDLARVLWWEKEGTWGKANTPNAIYQRILRSRQNGVFRNSGLTITRGPTRFWVEATPW